jgi:hypothetical protein
MAALRPDGDSCAALALLAGAFFIRFSATGPTMTNGLRAMRWSLP